MSTSLRKVEINGGSVETGPPWHLELPAGVAGYADAQLDDYGGRRRSDYAWRPGTRMTLEARFSHPNGKLQGTSGFGFWNAPFGDPTVPWPAMPQAAWFFYGSEPNDLPLAIDGPGRGWFGSTVNASGGQAVALVPLAPVVLLLNNVKRIRAILWPAVRARLGISYVQLNPAMTEWHHYRLEWLAGGCEFWIDEQCVLKTSSSPRGPLGFVCWMDNQFLVVRPTGRLRWGTVPVQAAQWLEVNRLRLETAD